MNKLSKIIINCWRWWSPIRENPLTCPNCGCSKRYNFSRQGKAPENHNRFDCYNCDHTFDLLATHPEAIQWADDLAASDRRGTGPC